MYRKYLTKKADLLAKNGIKIIGKYKLIREGYLDQREPLTLKALFYLMEYLSFQRKTKEKDTRT